MILDGIFFFSLDLRENWTGLFLQTSSKINHLENHFNVEISVKAMNNCL